eukprot:1649563-Pyramimonas_sp.AAC.1
MIEECVTAYSIAIDNIEHHEMRSSSIVRAVFVCALCAVGVKVVFFHSVATHPAHSHLNGVSPRNPFKHYSSAQSTHGSNRISEIEDRNSLLWDSAYDTDGRASVSTLSQCGQFTPDVQQHVLRYLKGELHKQFRQRVTTDVVRTQGGFMASPSELNDCRFSKNHSLCEYNLLPLCNRSDCTKIAA